MTVSATPSTASSRGVQPASRASRRGAALRFAAVSVQLGLVLALLAFFQIEEDYGLPRLLPLIFGGFLLHAALPTRWRTPFFVALSVAAYALLIGPKHAAGLVVLALGLIAVAHAPARLAVRVALLVAIAAALAAVRAGWVSTPWGALPDLVLPLLASMFMFRMAVYLYEVRHEPRPVPLADRLAYFFLLPNACFLLFPVVDFAAFRRSRDVASPVETYQKGVLWILRGLTHLLLYRLVYHHLVLTPSEVHDLAGVVQFVVTTYLLYLRISGQFHIIVGILCLFGFNLPETHHLYYLASGFTDYWRRINIYWKDFMTKLVYYPAFVRFRRWGLAAGVALAMLVVFFGTWVLHSYQWFWIRGSFPIRATDGLFWGILAALVVISGLRELRRGRERRRADDPRRAWLLSLRTVGTFVVLAVLWSLWSSSSVGDWLEMIASGGDGGVEQWLALIGVLAALVAVGYVVQRPWVSGLGLTGSHPSFARSAVWTAATATLLLPVGIAARDVAPERGRGGWLASLANPGISRVDQLRLDRGYYEGLLAPGGFVSMLARIEQPEGWVNLVAAGVTQPRPDLLEMELRPSYAGVFKGTTFRTNAWGMRDREYALEKAAGVRRVALLGASYEMGAGVEQEQTFESLVEDRLGDSVEILNFSVGGYSVLQNAILAGEKAVRFSPDLVVVAVHDLELNRITHNIAGQVHASPNRDLGALGVPDVLRRAGFRPGMDRTELERRLRPFAGELLDAALREIRDVARTHGAAAAVLYVPRTPWVARADTVSVQLLREHATRAGLPFLSLADAYGTYDERDVSVARFDDHPNALGHRLLAHRFTPLLRELLVSTKPSPHHRS